MNVSNLSWYSLSSILLGQLLLLCLRVSFLLYLYIEPRFKGADNAESMTSLSRANAISKITKEAAEIIGTQNIGQIKPGFKASIVVWNGDPFSLYSHPTLIIAEGRTVYDER
jgi:hypothetical protein